VKSESRKKIYGKKLLVKLLREVKQTVLIVRGDCIAGFVVEGWKSNFCNS